MNNGRWALGVGRWALGVGNRGFWGGGQIRDSEPRRHEGHERTACAQITQISQIRDSGNVHLKCTAVHSAKFPSAVLRTGSPDKFRETKYSAAFDVAFDFAFDVILEESDVV